MAINLDQMEVRFKNPETSKELVIPVVLVAPVSDEQQKDNCRRNSYLPQPWLDEKPAHDGIALVCGAGPSLEDTLPQIIEGHRNGATIFAANSATKFLNQKGIQVDYQVVLDPHPMIVDEIGFAKEYLFASIVPTELFSRRPNATLWHPAIHWLEDVIPNRYRNFTWIGGGATVTNSTLCIAYTLGFREIHCFGMDSSFRGDQKHVLPLQDNGQRVLVEVESNGKTYLTSFDMKQQVIIFKQLYELLKDAGCNVKVFGSGLLPDLYNH